MSWSKLLEENGRDETMWKQKEESRPIILGEEAPGYKYANKQFIHIKTVCVVINKLILTSFPRESRNISQLL